MVVWFCRYYYLVSISANDIYFSRLQFYDFIVNGGQLMYVMEEADIDFEIVDQFSDWS